jgi:hypothetical protein
MKNTTTNTTTSSTSSRCDHWVGTGGSSLYSLSDEDLKNKLTNRVVTYLNKGESTVKADGKRQLVIKEIDYCGYAKSTGRRYIQGKVQDLDDGGEAKFRSLHIAGITKVSGRISTAARMVKSLF